MEKTTKDVTTNDTGNNQSTTATPVLEKNFGSKQTGANLAVMFGTERYSRSVSGNKELADKVRTLGDKYNKRPTQKTKDDIIKLMKPEATKAKEEKEKTIAIAKGLNQQVKKVAKTAKKEKVSPEKRDLLKEITDLIKEKPEAVDAIQTLLNAAKKVDVKQPEPVVTSKPRGGESYRNY